MNGTRRALQILAFAWMGLVVGCGDDGASVIERREVDEFVPIYRIQGDGRASPLEGEVVATRGVVTGNFLGGDRLNGFFLQAEAGDGDPATSDGIFVYAPGRSRASVGDLVEVKGEVTELHGLTELTDVRSIERLEGGGSIKATPLRLPIRGDDGLERYEGMLVVFAQELTVSGNYHLGKYGQVTLASGGRLFQPTQIHPPGSREAAAMVERNRARRIVLDDGRQSPNPPKVPYLGDDGTLRNGDTVSGVTGALGYGPVSLGETFRDYRLQPTKPPDFNRANPRGSRPGGLAGSLQVAGFNVQNFFTTLADDDSEGARGAAAQEEFERQRRKLASAITAMNTAVVGLMEIENNGATAIGSLVAAINGHVDAGADYEVVPDPPDVGDDATKVGLIYQPEHVERVGVARSASNSVFSRPPVAQTFADRSSGAELTVIVNHWKSKSPYPPPQGRDKPQGDGQGAYNATRTTQARALMRFIESLRAESGAILVIGDLNAYAREDPVRLLQEEGGWVNEVDRHLKKPYSYTYAAQAGYLDYALTTPDLSEHVVGVTIWHINADEPPFLDYRGKPARRDRSSASPFRSSDHDPVILSLEF